MNILLVEDEPEVAASIAGRLRELGYEVAHAADGEAGYRLANSGSWQVLIVDRLLPRLDGLQLVRRLRAEGVATPVLFLTALGGIDDRVDGLDAGADDYLVKPFAFVELLARLRALTRRPATGAERETQLRAGELTLDLLQRTVTRGTRTIELLPQEFRLLEYLVRNANRVVTRAMLLENVWNIHFDPRTSVVESHISRLRARLNQDSATDLIQTVRGAGYRLSV